MKLKLLPNLLTAFRLVSIPLLLILVLFQQKEIFTIIFIIAGLTDIFDGLIARKLKVHSKFGAKFDSLSDDLLTVSTIVFLYILMPEIILENFLPLTILLIFFTVDYSLRLIKFKTVNVSFHSYLNKIGALTGFLFVTHALIFGYSRIFLYLLIIIGLLMAAEEIIACTIKKNIDENFKSIFLR